MTFSYVFYTLWLVRTSIFLSCIYFEYTYAYIYIVYFVRIMSPMFIVWYIPGPIHQVLRYVSFSMRYTVSRKNVHSCHRWYSRFTQCWKSIYMYNSFHSQNDSGRFKRVYTYTFNRDCRRLLWVLIANEHFLKIYMHFHTCSEYR